MANYNEHVCFTCGQIQDYCRHCAVTPVVYKAEGFCSEDCSHVFNTLSKHGCNLATAEETLAALGNIEGKTFTPSIKAHIDSIKAETKKASTKVEVESVKDEAVTEESLSDKKKKKW